MAVAVIGPTPLHNQHGMNFLPTGVSIATCTYVGISTCWSLALCQTGDVQGHGVVVWLAALFAV